MQRQRGSQHPQPAVDAATVDTHPRLRARDARAVGALGDVHAAHPYEGGWYNNATFVLPLLGAIAVLIAWAVSGSLELLGLSIFLFAVTGVMLPLVWLTWQRTPTVILVREGSLDALHQGCTLQSLPWNAVTEVRRVETLGNVRWYVLAQDGERIAIEGEIANVPALLAAARRRAGLPEEPPAS